MAYGKIKADAIIYDNSGSDVEKTIAVLADPTPEGTAIKSTGEAVTTKFLRTDGDGSSSWQVVPVPSTITVADESSDTTCFPLFSTAATGDLPPKTGTNLTFNSSSGLLTATSFNGALTGDVTGNADTATVATAVTVTDESTDTSCYVLFADGATGNLSVKSGTNLAFNSSTGLLSPSALTTTGNVTVGGDLTVSGSTTTVNTATLEVEDKNIELGKVSSPSDTTADGGGITLKGATDKEIKWVNATDNWTFNQNIELTKSGGSDAANLTVVGGEGNVAALYLICDEGDDNGDYWTMQASPGDNNLYFQNKTSGSYVTKAQITEEGEVHDAIGDLRAIPPNATTSAYTLVASDRGKCVTNTSGGVTIPYNVFAAGDAVTIINHSGSAITLTQGSNLTLYHTLNGATGNRTLKLRGMATVWYQAQNVAYIGGTGLS